MKLLLHPFGKNIDKKIPDRLYKFATNQMNVWSSRITSHTNPSTQKKSFSFINRYIYSRGFAFYFDTLSTIQSGKTISDLLNEFLETSRVKSLTDAMKVDPSVKNIPKIKAHIRSLSPDDYSEFRDKSRAAIEVPILSPHKNRVHIEVPMFLHFAAISGLLKEPYNLQPKELIEIAQELGVIPSREDVSPDFLKKQLKYFRTL